MKNNFIFFNILIILSVITFSVISKSYSIEFNYEKSYNIKKISIFEEDVFSSMSRSLETEDEENDKAQVFEEKDEEEVLEEEVEQVFEEKDEEEVLEEEVEQVFEEKDDEE